mmetsp:Transcript_9344/g.15889  ORF Transcript_9344/g.15889 Transcript_9344/m.15889 type:complete len:203 (+) Transcript_9344:363-971(+)
MRVRMPMDMGAQKTTPMYTWLIYLPICRLSGRNKSTNAMTTVNNVNRTRTLVLLITTHMRPLMKMRMMMHRIRRKKRKKWRRRRTMMKSKWKRKKRRRKTTSKWKRKKTRTISRWKRKKMRTTKTKWERIKMRTMKIKWKRRETPASSNNRLIATDVTHFNALTNILMTMLWLLKQLLEKRLTPMLENGLKRLPTARPQMST